QCDARRAQWHFERLLERTDDPKLHTAAIQGLADARMLQGQFDLALQLYLDVLERLETVQERLAVVNRAIYGLYLRGASDAAVALGARGLAMAGHLLPTTVPGALWSVTRSIGRLILRRRERDPEVADALALTHTYLMASVASEKPL